MQVGWYIYLDVKVFVTDWTSIPKDWIELGMSCFWRKQEVRLEWVKKKREWKVEEEEALVGRRLLL